MRKILSCALITAVLLGLLVPGISCTKTVYVTPTSTPILIHDKWAAIDIVKAYLLDSAKTPHGKDVLASVWQALGLGTAGKQSPSIQYPYGKWIVTFYIPSASIESSTVLSSIFTILRWRSCGTEFNVDETMHVDSWSCDEIEDILGIQDELTDYGTFYSMSWSIGPEKQVSPNDGNAIRFLAELGK